MPKQRLLLRHFLFLGMCGLVPCKSTLPLRGAQRGVQVQEKIEKRPIISYSALNLHPYNPLKGIVSMNGITLPSGVGEIY
jgi:hypothetical protein